MTEKPETIERTFKETPASFKMMKSAAMEVIRENADLLEQSSELQASFTTHIDGTGLRMKITMNVEIV